VSTGLLAIWHRVAAEADAELNAWYEAEHLAERLAIPGFRTARRYRALDDPLAYCALYELDDVAVLRSPAYLERLAAPSPRTRDIMPNFRDVTRAACRVAFDSEPGAAAAGWLAMLEPARVDMAALHALADPARVRLALPDGEATGGRTFEQQLRPAADRLPPTCLLLETGHRDVAETLGALAARTMGGPARVYACIASRP
jgi:catechol 2,3-dioxygenase-like lactoylglutathione lyase family enzyme